LKCKIKKKIEIRNGKSSYRKKRQSRKINSPKRLVLKTYSILVKKAIVKQRVSRTKKVEAPATPVV
jgi:hypothetical protein